MGLAPLELLTYASLTFDFFRYCCFSSTLSCNVVCGSPVFAPFLFSVLCFFWFRFLWWFFLFVLFICWARSVLHSPRGTQTNSCSISVASFYWHWRSLVHKPRLPCCPLVLLSYRRLLDSASVSCLLVDCSEFDYKFGPGYGSTSLLYNCNLY